MKMEKLFTIVHFLLIVVKYISLCNLANINNIFRAHICFANYVNYKSNGYINEDVLEMTTMSSLTVFLLVAVATAQSCINRNTLSSFSNVEYYLNNMENNYLSKCGNGTEYSHALDKLAEHSRKIKEGFRYINDIYNRKNWKRYNGHCYLLSAESRNWEDAEKRCQDMSSSLVAIRDKSENTWLQQEISNAGGNNFWIGLTADEHQFYWIQNKQTPKYQQFASGYPTPSTSRCVYMNSANWYNYNCINNMYFICESESCDK